jgi:hypothetical protein
MKEGNKQVIVLNSEMGGVLLLGMCASTLRYIRGWTVPSLSSLMAELRAKLECSGQPCFIVGNSTSLILKKRLL